MKSDNSLFCLYLYLLLYMCCSLTHASWTPPGIHLLLAFGGVFGFYGLSVVLFSLLFFSVSLSHSVKSSNIMFKFKFCFSSFWYTRKGKYASFFVFIFQICSTQLTSLPNFLLSFVTENLTYRPTFILSFNFNRIHLKSFYPELIFTPGLSSWLTTTKSYRGIRNLSTLACDKPVGS